MSTKKHIISTAVYIVTCQLKLHYNIYTVSMSLLNAYKQT